MQKPRIKSCYSISADPDEDGTLYVGHVLGYASVIEDVDEPLLRMLALLDGEHTFSEIAAALQEEGIEATEEDVQANLRILEEYGFLEDASVPIPGGLSDSEWERYDRQILFFSIFEDRTSRRYEYQKILKKSRVTILGLGGLGSHVLYHLAAAGVGDMLGVDFDVVELSNLSRQALYCTSDVGRPKVEAARERVEVLNPHIRFEGRRLRISSADDLQDLVRDRDLVVVAADTPPGWIQHWVNQACLVHQVPYISAGYTEQAGQVGPLTIPYETSCYDCRCFSEGRPPLPDRERLLVNRRQNAPSLGPLSGMTGSFTSLEIIKYLTGFSPPVTLNRICTIDIGTMEITSRVLNERSLSCPSCGERAHQEMGFREKQRLVVL